MKKIVLLGSTGSIGTQTLDVIAEHPDKLQVVGLAAGRNKAKLKEQAERFGVKHLALFEKDDELPSGMDALVRLATLEEADIVVVSVAGVIGLLPTLEAIKAKKQIALASKEVLVAAGEIVMPAIEKAGVWLTPIDSEHSAVFQCLNPAPNSGALKYPTEKIDKIFLTASGGPFRGWTREQLQNVTVQQALNHPTWNMGGKITIDSATLMNKALETIEAKWLFGLRMDQIEVQVHPQSVVHSVIRYKDGSALSQMGWPNMRLPIAYSLLYPERIPNSLAEWTPADTPALTFERVDENTFPALKLAREAERLGGTMPCAFNAANEEAANSFLAGNVSFLGIYEIVEKTMAAHQVQPASLDSLLWADGEARQFARKLMKGELKTI